MIQGVDLSDWNGLVDFSALHDGGYGFAISKATEGTGNTQSTFAHNRDTARARGIVFGAYHFFSWVEDPVAQAAHFLATYMPTNGDLPPALDCEGELPYTVDEQGHRQPDPHTAVKKMATWLDYVEAHMNGRKCLIYGSFSFFADYLGDLRADFGGHPWWVASWGDVPPTDLHGAVRLWQFAEATVGGVCNGVNPDPDRFLGSSSGLRTFVLP